MRLLVLGRRLTTMPEFGSAIGAIIWAKWVYFEPVSLSLRQPYRVLTGAIPAGYLEALALTIGITQLAAVIYRRRWPRVVTGVVATSFWGTLFYGLWLGERSAPAATGYLILAMQDFGMMMLLCCPRRFGPRE